VNGSLATTANLNGTTPAAGSGYTLGTWQVSGNNVSVEFPTQVNADWTSSSGASQVLHKPSATVSAHSYTLTGSESANTAAITVSLVTPGADTWYTVGGQMAQSQGTSGGGLYASVSWRWDYTNADNGVAVTGVNNGLLIPEGGAATSTSVSIIAGTLTAQQIWDTPDHKIHVKSGTVLKAILNVVSDGLTGFSPFPTIYFNPVFAPLP
jgi:hypothetical protein